MTDLVARLVRLGQTVGCAESLTGGLVVARLVDAPGASAVVRGGVVAYATDLKASVLGVDADLLERRGAVDAEVARQLAVGARRVLGADWGLATTGVAGPEPQDGMPVGCVYVAVAGPGAAGPAGPTGPTGLTGPDGPGGPGGPGGPMEPGGTAGPAAPQVVVERHDLAGDRSQVRAGAVDAVLALLERCLPSASGPPSTSGPGSEGSSSPAR